MPCPTTVMSCPQLHLASVLTGQRNGERSLAARALQSISARWQAYWTWRARRATVLLLHALDARTLHDIGIAPGEIESLVHGRSHCRRYDPAWPRWR